MKKLLLPILLLCLAAQSFAAAAAYDIILSQRPDSGSGPNVERLVTPTAAYVIGFDGSKHPTAINLSGLGFGNVTAASTLTSGDIVIGQGTKATATTSTIQVSGGNVTINGNATITSNLTAANVTATDLAVSGTISGAGVTFFKNVVVSGCTTVSGNTTGNLTLVAGGNITLTTDNTAKSVTIASSGGGGGATNFDTATLSSDNTKVGITVSGQNAGASLTQWDLVYMGASSTWLKADANGSGTYPARGMAVAAYSNTDPAVVIREGIVRHDAWSWTPGGTLYMSITAGEMTQTPPSTATEKIQQVGFAITADIAYVNFASGEYLTVP